MRTRALGCSLALVVACAPDVPARSGPVPSSSEGDPWQVPSGAGVTQGEPDAAFVPPQRVSPSHDAGATEDGGATSRESVESGPLGSPPADRRPVSAVEARMSSIRARMRRCFDKALAADPNLRGPSAAKLDFGPDGKPARVTFGGKPPRPGLETCLADVIRQGMDPSAEGAASITIPISESASD